jgi:hypothetical protein
MSGRALLILILAAVLAAAFAGCRNATNPVDIRTAYVNRLARPDTGGTAPYVIIDKPAPSPTGGTQVLGRVILFGWHSGPGVEPHFVRWLCMQNVDTNGVYNPNFNIVQDLNENLWRYESKWSAWVPYKNPHGRSTVVGKDDTLQLNRSYLFAVQARDFSDRVTTIFDTKTNVRRFIVSLGVAPYLRVFNHYVGGFAFIGTNMGAKQREFAPGLDISFEWHADASSYGGEIVGYRYGWDVADINVKHDWEVKFSLDNTTSPPISFQSGTHTLYIEALDNNGAVTVGRIELVIVPFTMERSLLWVDDYYTAELNMASPDYNYAAPSLSNFKNFWIGQCSKASGFDQSQDVYVVADHNFTPPPMSLVAGYKNVIWSFSSAPDYGAWDDVILFTPEIYVTSGSKGTLNYIAVFLAKGGHLLSEGRADRAGGLAAALLPTSQIFPLSFQCEITGPRTDCNGDQSGIYSMPYRDYCVSVVDKIAGSLRSRLQFPDMPVRTIRNYDCMTTAVKSDDVVAGILAGLPDTLSLWSDVLKPQSYFNLSRPAPFPGGFTYVEVYDPAYWMTLRGYASQDCFHPLYRMRSKSSASALDNTAMALCLTKYDTVVPSVSSGVAVAAKSFHFGTELWFFDRRNVDQIMGVIFNEWQIKKP